MLKKPTVNLYAILSLVCIAASSLSAEELDTSETTLAPAEILSTQTSKVEIGKQLFSNYCKHCHETTYEESVIGAPGLQSVLERHDEAWLDKWLKSPGAFAKTDVAARDLIDANPYRLVMPTLPAMQDNNSRLAIIEYLKTLK